MSRYLVTGGTGFVGKALALRLRSLGHDVIAISRRNSPDLQSAGIQLIREDISRPSEQFYRAFEGVRAVFHTAAKVDLWGPKQEFYRTNVIGTRNVIEGCLRSNVRSLVYTSSPSVISGSRALVGADESIPYPETFLAAYPETKAEAEQILLRQDGKGELRTISLRPHLIFGPGDTNLIPTVLKRARAGKLIRIGDGLNRVDFTYIDDCVEAHILAAAALETNPRACGRAFFISQGDPTSLWEWVDLVLASHDLPPVHRSISPVVAASVAWLLESIYRLLPWQPEPPLSRFLVHEMSTEHFFNIHAAKQELGFQPTVTVRQGLELTFQQGDPVSLPRKVLA